MKRRIAVIGLLAVLILPVLAAAQTQVVWVKEYDPAAGEFPEGIAVDLKGNIYIAMAALGQVRRISPDGTETLFYQFPPAAGVQLLGLTVDALGNVYVCAFSPYAPEYQGVWRIDRRGGAEQLPGTEAIGLPNALAFDPRGNLYVTDSWVPGIVPPEGAVWRIPRGGEAEVWYQDGENLGGLGQIPGYPPLGANGIVYYDRALYVANTERGHIVRIPVSPDGGPGEAEVLADDPTLYLIDGITVDVHGRIAAAIIGQNSIVGICARTGSFLVLAAGDPIDGPASTTFGAGVDSVSTVFFSNYAVLSEEPRPGVLKMELSWPPGNRP
jgi:sugar lactone lactonase YvrE